MIDRTMPLDILFAAVWCLATRVMIEIRAEGRNTDGNINCPYVLPRLSKTARFGSERRYIRDRSIRAIDSLPFERAAFFAIKCAAPVSIGFTRTDSPIVFATGWH